MSPARLLIATPHRGLAGGIEVYVRSVIPALQAAGHEVALLYERAPSRGEPDIAPPDLPAWSGSEPREALRRARAWRPDLIYMQGLLDADLEEACARSFPTVFFAHGYYGTCATGTKLHTFPEVATCRRRLGRSCLALNYTRRCGGLNPLTLARRYRRESRRRRMLEAVEVVAVASRHMQDELRRQGVREPHLHLVPLPHSLPLDPEPPSSRARRLEHVLWLGRATDLKGGDRLIAAIPEASERLGRALRLTVAGRGPALAKWRELATQLRVATTFPGWVDADERSRLLRDADLLAVPSIWPEPFGMIGIEAGCVGLPAVAYGLGGITDWLQPGESGELAPGDPPTVEGLVDALVRALADPEHHARLSRGAWETARRFSMERHLTALEATFSAALG